MNVLVVGGSGGIGSALVKHILESRAEAHVFATFKNTPLDHEHDRLTPLFMDIEDEASIISGIEKISPLTWAVNAVGLLHNNDVFPEKSLAQFNGDSLIRNIQVNTLPSLLLAKHLERQFVKDNTAIFATVSAKVGSIEDNRLGGWYSYRTSKAALNMELRTLSIEWKRKYPNRCIAALHPGTTATNLSQPFQKNVPKEKLFSPQQTAEYLFNNLAKLTPDDTGRFWSWDGSEIPW